MTRDQKKAESRRRILDAARDVFFRDGFMKANLDEMADKAGVAKGTLYRYFESKADLYVAVLARNSQDFVVRMEEAATHGENAIERLHSIARFYFQHWLDHPDNFQIFWAIDNESVIGDLPREAIEETARYWEFSLNILNGVLERGVREGEFVEHDTWEIAHVLWSIANALIESDNTKARRKIRKRPLEPLYEHAIDIVIRGILTEPARIDVAPPTPPPRSTLVPAGSS